MNSKPSVLPEKKSYYIVKRYILEEYEVLATSKGNAKQKATEDGDPHKITVIKETAIRQKQ